MPSTSPVVCIECRTLNGCPRNIHETHYMSYRWRGPKKSNDKAWKLIESGDWLWDKRKLRKIKQFSLEDFMRDNSQKKPGSKMRT